MKMKVCTRCLEEVELNLYPKDKKRADGLHSWCRACHAESARLKRKGLYEPKKYNLVHRAPCKPQKDYSKAQYYRLKKAAFDHYGNKCNCCGEQEPKFLTMDHVNNDGNKHLQKNGKRYTGGILYGWLKRNGYPEDYQVLCWNCNCGKACNGGICPHKA